jgi:hypothetical protein
LQVNDEKGRRDQLTAFYHPLAQSIIPQDTSTSWLFVEKWSYTGLDLKQQHKYISISRRAEPNNVTKASKPGCKPIRFLFGQFGSAGRIQDHFQVCIAAKRIQKELTYYNVRSEDSSEDPSLQQLEMVDEVLRKRFPNSMICRSCALAEGKVSTRLKIHSNHNCSTSYRFLHLITQEDSPSCTASTNWMHNCKPRYRHRTQCKPAKKKVCK